MKFLKRTGFILLCVLTVVFGLVSTSPAQIQPGSMSLTPQIGWFIFDNDENIDNDAYLGLSFRANVYENWSIESALGYVGTERDDRDMDVNAYLSNFNVLYHFKDFNDFVPYLTAGLGMKTLDYDRGGGDSDGMFNYGAGVDFFIRENLSLRCDVKHLLSLEDSDDNFLATVGLSFFFGGAKAAPPPPKDSDGDGVYDDQDKCPDTPTGVKVDPEGCPLDTDKDGVYDYLDKCPGTGEWIRVDEKGCPLDDDNDGVYNHLDQCPLTPAGVKVDAKGCPLDSDNDGVYDYRDKCPGTPAGVKVDDNGCSIDTDRDGVYDSQDRCPGTPTGAKVDSRGCWVLEGVHFDTNKADIKPRYHHILDNAVSVMRKNPDLKIQIRGHTDSVGNRKYNLKLSQKRAQTVLEYFVQKGIDRTRMSAIGYGEDIPIASNETSAGRAQNRRVELNPVK